MATGSPKSFMHTPLPAAVSAVTSTTNTTPTRTATAAVVGATNPSINNPSAFVHNEDNNNVTSEVPVDFALNFEPNVLDNFDTYTYHWKFFITSLEDAKNGNVLNLDAQTIIAESGVSDLTIDKVEVHGIAVPSVEAGTGTQTIIKFEIVEPSGAGLLDKMYYQAIALGIGNWLVMPTFLQLEFRGRTPETAESTEAGLSGLKWVWPIKLTNTKANVTNVGTRYEFDAIMYDELAQSNSYFSIQHNIVLTEITDFKSAITDLENKLNADQFEKLIDNYSIPDTYQFHVDPAFAKKMITLPNQTENSSRNASFNVLGQKSAAFNAGTGIDKIVDALCGNMAYFQKKMQNAPAPSAQPRTSTTETNQMKSLWRVITETKPIAYDLLRQDNAVEIHVYIVEYDLGMVDVDAAQTGQTPESISAEKKRFLEYAQKKIMKKKYNYIFTGLNDQIRNLDLNMNFAFAASLSRFGGLYYDSSIKDTGIIAQKLEEQKNVAEQLRQTLQFINNASNSTADIAAKIASTQAAINAANLNPTQAARYTNLLTYARSPDKRALAQQIANNGGVQADGTNSAAAAELLKSQRSLAKTIAAPISATNSNGDNINLTFVSDVNTTSSNAKLAESNLINLKKGKLRPIPYRENMHEIMLAGGIDPDSNAARARVSSVFATALYSSLDASLQVLKLTIKGDPFWLFPTPVNGLQVLPYKSNMTDEKAIETIKSAHKTNNSVNLFGTDNFIVVRFRTPRIYNITSEQEVDPYTEVNAFSGVYKVITIISKFEMGVFSQELSCILDPVIDIQDFLQAMEASSGKTPPDLRTQGFAGQITPDTLNPTFATPAVNSTLSNIPTIPNPTPNQLVAQTLSAAGKP